MPRELNSTFVTEKNKQENSPIYLYEINFQLPESDPDNWLYYAGTDFDVEFSGKTYQKFPIEFESISENSQGEIDRVGVRLANVSRLIQYYLEQYNGLRGRKVIIKMVWANRLNEPDCYIKDIYYVANATANEYDVNFVLTSKFDLMQVELPRGTYMRNFCRFGFKTTECGYAGEAAECNKTLNRCRELLNSKRFGGTPSVPSRFIYLA